MAAKLLHSFTDDKPDLQKQIGCMTGIFQMFDRQHMLTSRSMKRLPPGNPHIRNHALERESNGADPKSSSLDKDSYTNMQERQRYSVESSRPSFSSSSHSSSFSSLDCNRVTQSQLEQGSFDRMLFPDTPSRDPAMSLQSALSRQTVDLRDLVKESIYRDSQGSSVKAKSAERAAVPFVLTKKQTTPADIKESLRILAKLEEAPRCRNEPGALLRSSSFHYKDGSSFSVAKDAPRFSYDVRETNRSSLEPRDGSISALKLKDLPRLSLDSRESSMRGLGGGGVEGKSQMARPPSVVAKLMGLDTLPDSVSSGDNNMGSTRSSFEQTESIKPAQLSSPSKNSCPSSPRWRNSDSSIKPMSRLPIEPAPWKQSDGMRSSQKSASRAAKAPTMFPSVYSEIDKRLGNLEFTQSGKDLRALKQILEAMQAKGLLETPKEGQGSNFTSHEDHEEKVSNSTRSVDTQKLQSHQVLAITKRKALSAHNHESQIVIMKPARLAEKSGIPAGSVTSLDGLSSRPKLRGGESVDNRKGSNSGRTSKDVVLKSSQRDNVPNSVNMKNNRALRATQTSMKSQQLDKEGSAGLGKISGSVSPRMQQKKVELERRSRPPTPPDSSISRRQLNKQQVESNSPGGRRRPKHVYPQKSDEQLSEVSFDSRNSSPPENEDSAESNEIISHGSGNVEFSSSGRSTGTTRLKSSSAKDPQFKLSRMVEKKSTLKLSEEEAAEIGYEYSSPVSVLDNAVYTHDSPSPIKYTGKTLKVDVTMVKERDPNPAEQSSPESYVSSSIESASMFDYNREKLQNIDNLVQKLRKLNSSHDEARTDYIASLCENTNPDHRYISEILLASGLLLRDLGSSLTDFQFHPSGHPINPELFLVLEQTKASSLSKQECTTKTTTNSEKLQRKLIFDAVNEILAAKLASADPHSEPWWRQVKLARKKLNAQNLLKELCAKIDELQTKNPKCVSGEEDYGWMTIFCQDPLLQSENWMHFDDEISGAVLDIERRIFKDLVDEIVRGESAGLITKPCSFKASATSLQ